MKLTKLDWSMVATVGGMTASPLVLVVKIEELSLVVVDREKLKSSLFLAVVLVETREQRWLEVQGCGNWSWP